MKQLGVPSRSFLNRARLPVEWESNPDALVADARLWWLLQDVADREGLSDFGMRAGVGGTLADIGGFGARLLASVSLLDAMQKMALGIDDHSSDARFGVTPGNRFLWFWRQGIPSIDAGRDQAEQYILVFMIQLVRAVAGPDWMPPRIRLRAIDADWALGCPLLDGTQVELGAATTAVWVPNPLLSCAFPRKPSPCAAPPTESPARDLPGSLRQALTPLLGEQPLRLELAAEIAGMSPRTLERRLADDSLTWRRLAEQILFDAATEMLRDPDRAIIEIACDLGYSDPANFSRAFRRWAGSPPSAYREALRASA
ncbi:MAG: helix-turn-helix domain-containing protein [Deltaproteobacteria bacterium]|nr:helix-turn-helix domain-containing protein [Deltaproteobacteria bacterium]